MPFSVRIEFHGLCAFVPRNPPGQAQLILPNAREPRAGSDGTLIRAHYPYVQFDPDDIYDGGKRPERWLRVEERDEGLRFPDSAQGFWFLDWEDLKILPDPDQLPRDGRPRPELAELQVRRDEVLGDRASPDPMVDNQRRDFSWVPPMEQIAPGCGKIDPLCLGSEPPRERVVARVFLDRGELVSGSLSEEGSQLFLWEFRTPGDTRSRLTRAVATSVALELEGVKKFVRFEAKRFGSGKTQALDLAPLSGEFLTLSIRNQEVEEITGMSDYLRPGPGNSDAHFELFYDLCETTPGDRPLPRRLLQPQMLVDAGDIRGGSSGLICPNTQFTAEPMLRKAS